jgi:hypothetical protein
MKMGTSILRATCRRTVPALAVASWLLAGCTAGEVELYEPEGSGLGRGLTVKVVLDEAAAEVGEALGWSDGVPDAEVRVHRVGTELHWQTEFTDSAGEARFPDLIQGTYRVAAYRVLTDEEAVQLGDRRRAFADGTKFTLVQSLTRTLQLMPEEPGSLVISEVYATVPYSTETQYNDYHMFLELYNNSDTTVFLDGMIVGTNYGLPIHPTQYYTCEASAPFRNDPNGFWALFFHRFPGTGAEYPLGPGETAVIAVDAVDHSALYPRYPNLAHADFEFLGPADVDNPAVPNMPEVGLRTWPEGHGVRLGMSLVFFLSSRVDLDALVRRIAQPSQPGLEGVEYVRFPREAIVDALATVSATSEQLRPRCDEWVHRNFDRLEGGGARSGEDVEYSVQRVVIGYTQGGRAILQDTNTSAVDLVRALYTVGTLPQPQLGGARSATGRREH